MSRKILALALALALLCGCAGERRGMEEPPEGQYSVYFAAAAAGEDGAVLDREFRSIPAGRGAVEGLLEVLLSGPVREELVSPFPGGTGLRNWSVEEGLARVDLSEAYGGLSGGALTLADGCVVLTLCQLPNVDRVYLTVEGRPRPFRDQVLSPEDFLLDSDSGGERELEAELWFLLQEGLGREERTLRLAPGDQAAIAAVQALLAGPEGGDLAPICPEGSELLSLTAQGKTFTLDLNGRFWEGEADPRRLWAVVDTLDALEEGAQVVFCMEGQPVEVFGDLALTAPLGAEER